MHALIFYLDSKQYAVDLSYIRRIIWAVEITSLPNQQAFIQGIINYHGDITPVINLRQLLGLSSKEISINDHLILCHVNDKPLAFLVDQVKKVVPYQNVDLSPIHESEISLNHSTLKQYALKEAEQLTIFFDLGNLIPSQSLTVV